MAMDFGQPGSLAPMVGASRITARKARTERRFMNTLITAASGGRFDGGRDGDADLAIIAGGAGVERQERVPVEIGWDGIFRNRNGADEFLVMLEDRFDNPVSEVIGNV